MPKTAVLPQKKIKKMNFFPQKIQFFFSNSDIFNLGLE